MTVDAAFTLDDKYVLDQGRLYLSGIQALVKLPMLQHLRDRAAGLNTGGFVSGYRGSPLGGLDKELWRAAPHLERHSVRFQPGLNEDLAATAVWGTQQIGLFPGPAKDGVFAMWYGKGPGLDRSLDVFKHANSRRNRAPWRRSGAGGRRSRRQVLDPGAPERTCLHGRADAGAQSGPGCRKVLDFGLFGWALSRFSGLWVGMKTISETVESSASVLVDPWRLSFVAPEGFEGLHILRQEKFLEQEHRLMPPAHSRRPGLRQAQPHRPGGDRFPRPPLRHRHHRQILSGRAPGPGRSGHRRAPRRRDRHPPLQGRHVLAAGTVGHPRLRRGSGGNSGGGGEAGGHRGTAEGPALQLAGGRAPPRAGRTGRDRRLGPAPLRRADSGHDRPGDRRAHRHLLHVAAGQGTPGIPRRQGTAAGRRAPRLQPHSLFLRRLSPQHLHQGAGGQSGHGGHRLSLHGHLDGPRDPDLHPYGRRRGDLDRPDALHHHAATCSRIWATAPTPIPARWPSAPPWRPRSTSPTRFSTTTPWP